jgi:hypothetical protein
MNSKRGVMIGVSLHIFMVISGLYLYLLIQVISIQDTFDNTHGASCLIVNETSTKADDEWIYNLTLQTPTNVNFTATAECDEPNCYKLNSSIPCWENSGKYSLDSPKEVDGLMWAYLVFIHIAIVSATITVMDVIKREATRDSDYATYDTAYMT